MLDIHRVMAETEAVAKRLDDRGPGVGDLVRKTAARYEEVKRLKTKSESLQAEKNSLSKEIPKLIKADPTKAEALKARSKAIGPEIEALTKELEGVEAEVNQALLSVPNVPLPEVPVGKNEHDNKIVKTWGEPKKLSFKALDHVDLGKKLGIIDPETGVKLAQTRFVLLRGMAARLQLALISFMVDRQIKAGYEQVWPPFLVNAKALTGTGQLPKFEADLFKTTNDPPLYLIPTAEVPVTNIYAGEILEPGVLPKHFCAYTACFRSEAGSYGKDTRGMIRNHQFEKVELVKITLPEKSPEELEALTANAEAILEELKLPYRRMLLCTADMGFGSAKTYDLEVWLPGQDAYREISSCTNFLDFQARRASIRFRREAKAKPEFAHTLNGSGLAVGRTLVAVLENYQRADGSVEIPEPLRPYLGGASEIRA